MRTHRPRFRSFAAMLLGAAAALGGAASSGVAQCNSWGFFPNTLGSGIPTGAFVRDIIEYNGEKYAAIGDHIAKLNGNTWQIVKSSFQMRAFDTWQGGLVAAGLGGVFMTYDGSDWIDLQHPGGVNDVITFNGDLIVSTHNAVSRLGIVGGWQPLGSDFSNHVNALCEFNGMLIAGGSFTSVAQQGINRVAAWNGTQWVPLGAGIADGSVVSLVQYHGTLVAGGNFTEAGNSPVSSIARWDGAMWTPMLGGVAGSIYTMAPYGGDLFVAGAFTSASGNSSIKNVARWRDYEAVYGWHPAGTLGSHVNSLRQMGSALAAVGVFTDSVNPVVKNFAVWEMGLPDIVQEPEHTQATEGETVTFSVELATNGPLPVASYIWRRDGVSLAAGNHGNVSGLNSPTITLTNVTTLDAGVYDVAIVNACGARISTPAALFVQQQEHCPADITSDNMVNVSDLLQVISNWGACPN